MYPVSSASPARPASVHFSQTALGLKFGIHFKPDYSKLSAEFKAVYNAFSKKMLDATRDVDPHGSYTTRKPEALGYYHFQVVTIEGKQGFSLNCMAQRHIAPLRTYLISQGVIQATANPEVDSFQGHPVIFRAVGIRF